MKRVLLLVSIAACSRGRAHAIDAAPTPSIAAETKPPAADAAPPPPPPEPTLGKVVRVRMVGAEVGWAIDDQRRVSRTEDGGAHFRLAAPLAIPEREADAVQEISLAALDAKTAWLVEPVLDKEDEQGPGPSIRIHRTSDAGKTWQTTTITSEAASHNWGGQATIADAQRGWLGIEPQHGMQSVRQIVFRTEDGGKSFKRAGVVTGNGGIVVRGLREAYTMGTMSSTGQDAVLSRTRNGGASWSEIKLPFKPSPKDEFLSVRAVSFWGTDRAEGGLFARTQKPDGESDRILFLTHDGGGTWTATTREPGDLCSDAAVAAEWGAVAIASEALASNPRVVVRSAEGSWRTVGPAPEGTCGQGLEAPSAKDFFLVPTNREEIFWASHDGGATWTRPKALVVR